MRRLNSLTTPEQEPPLPGLTRVLNVACVVLTAVVWGYVIYRCWEAM